MRSIPAVALTQTPRAELHLRAENLHALALAQLDPDTDILCIDDVLISSAEAPFPSSSFALVDHNRLHTRFSRANPSARVVAVVDHHADEGLYRDSADPRLITVPTFLSYRYRRDRARLLSNTDGPPPRTVPLRPPRAAANYRAWPGAQPSPLPMAGRPDAHGMSYVASAVSGFVALLVRTRLHSRGHIAAQNVSRCDRAASSLTSVEPTPPIPEAIADADGLDP